MKDINDKRTGATAYVDADVLSRRYIGGSSIGGACERQIALRLRGFPRDPLPAFRERTLQIGHLLEGFVLGVLKERMPTTQFDHTGEDQYELKSEDGNIVMHPDGVLVPPKKKAGLLEIKTANDGSFRSTERLGTKYAHPEYYDQMQLGMGMAGLEQGLMVMINKNDSRMFVETIKFDEMRYHYLLARAEYIMAGLDEKCAQRETDFRCSFCDYNQVCWDGVEVRTKDRTCRHCRWGQISSHPDHFVHCTNRKSEYSVIRWDMTEWDRVALCNGCPYFDDYRNKNEKPKPKPAEKTIAEEALEAAVHA